LQLLKYSKVFRIRFCCFFVRTVIVLMVVPVNLKIYRFFP
jgi:hypothetical protein